MFKPGIIGYIPPPQFKQNVAGVFLDNLKRHPAKHDICLYSDHPYDLPWIKHFVKLKGAPDAFKNFQVNGKLNEWAMNNAIWLAGMKIARDIGFTHIIYLESDCRVGEVGWDVPMYEEYFNLRKPCIAAGSLVCWNPTVAGMEGLKRWEALISSNRKRNFPIPTYGWGSTVKDKVCVFPNGALGVYDMTWILKLFDVNDQTEILGSHAWDFCLGERIWAQFGLQSYDMVANLNCVFSSYGDVITTEPERLQMLKDKRVVSVHQIKSHATI